MSDGCPIWGSAFPAISRPSTTEYKTLVDDSPRAGGSFQIDDNVKRMVGQLPNDAKARLTTWVVDQNDQRVWMPEVTQKIVEYAMARPSLPVYERASRLLRWIAGQKTTIGSSTGISKDTLPLYAWSESVNREEIESLLFHLEHQGLLMLHRPYGDDSEISEAKVTVEGYRQVETQVKNPLSSQGFIAMWFDDSMKEFRDKGIKAGIVDAGYKPYVVDEDDYLDKIDDKIIAEIRRSRFIVADFTHGENGARGGVYYEAGFASGLGIPVIHTCHKDQLDDVHFDTRQFPHVLWKTPEELREGLRNRIRALLGQGPEPTPGS